MKTIELKQDEVRGVVRERYGDVAQGAPLCNPGSTCCSPNNNAGDMAKVLGYSDTEITAVPDGANLGLGCGNPLAIASLRPGQVVLDLGSGAGFDAFLAARAVGPTGRVIGVDMTPAMISKARANKARGDYAHVEFRLGEIEHLPVSDNCVDVILSNCVINLSPDKAQVFSETFRVLKPGGRLAISDMVGLKPFPAELPKDWELYTCCITGAALKSEIESILHACGFVDIRVEPKPGSREVIQQWFPDRGLEEFVASATIEAVKPA